MARRDFEVGFSLPSQVVGWQAARIHPRSGPIPGARGPRKPHAVPGNVNLIDVGEVVSGAIEHSYFVNDDTTIHDVRQVLAGAAPDRINGRRYLTAQNRFILG